MTLLPARGSSERTKNPVAQTTPDTQYEENRQSPRPPSTPPPTPNPKLRTNPPSSLAPRQRASPLPTPNPELRTRQSPNPRKPNHHLCHAERSEASGPRIRSQAPQAPLPHPQPAFVFVSNFVLPLSSFRTQRKSSPEPAEGHLAPAQKIQPRHRPSSLVNAPAHSQPRTPNSELANPTTTVMQSVAKHLAPA